MAHESNLAQFLKSKFSDQSAALDRDPQAVKGAIHEIMNFQSGRFPSVEEMDSIFEISPSLGFTILQHCGAVGILSRSKSWIEKNPSLWTEIVAGKHLVGFATTHLRYSRPAHAHFQDGKIHGLAPWSSGYEIFNSYLLGCRDDQGVLLIRMDYPEPEAEKDSKAVVRFKRTELAAMNGTSSIALEFNGATFQENDLVSRHTSWPPNFTEKAESFCVDYINPFFGVLLAVLSELSTELDRYSGTWKTKFVEAYEQLKKRTEDIRAKRSAIARGEMANEHAFDDFQFEFANLWRDSVQALTIVCGGSSLGKNSSVARRHLELILADALSSSEYLRDRKLGITL